MTRVALHSFLAVYHALCIFAYSVVGTCFVACCNQCYPAVFVVGFPLQVLIGCNIIANCVLSLPPPSAHSPLSMLNDCKKQDCWVCTTKQAELVYNCMLHGHSWKMAPILLFFSSSLSLQLQHWKDMNSTSPNTTLQVVHCHSFVPHCCCCPKQMMPLSALIKWCYCTLSA